MFQKNFEWAVVLQAESVSKYEVISFFFYSPFFVHPVEEETWSSFSVLRGQLPQNSQYIWLNIFYSEK